jgi:hypothetical protein
MTSTDSESASPWCEAIAISVPAASGPTCKRCHQPFKPRRGGGSKQRFCSSDCRTAHNNSQRIKRINETLEHINETPQRVSETLDTLKTSTAAVPTPPPAPKAPDFDWRDDPDIVIPSQDAIACYYNDRGAIVIRQQAAQNLPQYVLRVDSSGDIYAEGVDELLYGRLSNVL